MQTNEKCLALCAKTKLSTRAVYSGLGICSLVIRANRSFYVSEGRIAKVQFALKKLANNSHHSLFKSVSLSSLFFKEIDTESLMVAL